MKTIEKQNNLFTSDDIGIICPKNKKWENMVEVINGRFCDGCHETLHDVTGYSKGEVMALQREHGKNICVAVSKKLLTASLALSLAACSSKVKKEETEHVSDINTTQIEERYDVLTVVGMPVFRKEKVEK
jgi:hypothetical protein